MNKFQILVAAKNKLYEEFKKFNNANATYHKYQLGTKLDNNKLFNYTDFGEKNNWCNRTTFISMTLNNKNKDKLYLKMKYLKMNEPFKIFANNVLIYENKIIEKSPPSEETSTFVIPASAIGEKNQLSVKFDWPYNNVNRVFGVCIKEFSIDTKE